MVFELLVLGVLKDQKTILLEQLALKNQLNDLLATLQIVGRIRENQVKLLAAALQVEENIGVGGRQIRKEVDAMKKPGLVNFYGDPVGESPWKKGRAGRKDSDKIKLRLDPIHLNSEGRYLQACTWLATLFGCDVTKLKYAPECLASERATLMRECAAEAAAKYAKKVN